MINTVVFDMDGTILDTIPGLKYAMTEALRRAGYRAEFTDEQTKGLFGSGVNAAIRRALALVGQSPAGTDGISAAAGHSPAGTDSAAAAVRGSGLKVGEASEEEILRIKNIYMPIYEACCVDGSFPYEGIPELLRDLKDAGYKTAVVSNKPDAAVKPLAEKYFPGLFDLAVGEREGIRRKPAPDMVLEALRLLGTDPSEAVYVGDSEVDLETAANSSLPCIAVDWGFRSREYIESLGAGPIVSAPAEIMSLLE